MEIYIVRPGDSIDSIARAAGLPMSQILADNQPPNPADLVPGQALVLRFPKTVHTVRPGDTLDGVARDYGVTVRQLYRNNLILGGSPTVWPGQTLVIDYEQTPGREVTVNGYAYPFINRVLLQATLPFLSWMAPFSYGIRPNGTLVEPEDEALISMAERAGTAPLMHLSTLTDEGTFSNTLASRVLNEPAFQQTVISNVLSMIEEKRYRGLDVDFEFIFPQDAGPYAAFLANLNRQLTPLGLPLAAALAPKTSADQPGLLYEGHDYKAVGAAADFILLMTYEWGYTYGPPMAVAPMPNVRRVVEYAITEIPAEKLWLGMPNYGYDWPLPYRQGVTRATSISNRYAVSLARRYGVSIQFDETAQVPWFRYRDERGNEHEVWFEDARSVQAKLTLVGEYGLDGAGYWNLMRPFPQNWLVLDSMYRIRPSAAVTGSRS